MFGKIGSGLASTQSACRDFASQHKIALTVVSVVALAILLGYMHPNSLGMLKDSVTTLGDLGHKVQTTLGNMPPAELAYKVVLPILALLCVVGASKVYNKNGKTPSPQQPDSSSSPVQSQDASPLKKQREKLEEELEETKQLASEVQRHNDDMERQNLVKKIEEELSCKADNSSSTSQDPDIEELKKAAGKLPSAKPDATSSSGVDSLAEKDEEATTPNPASKVEEAANGSPSPQRVKTVGGVRRRSRSNRNRARRSSRKSTSSSQSENKAQRGRKSYRTRGGPTTRRP